MTKASVEELVKAARPRYVKGGRGEKTSILDEFVAVNGYHRKVAIADCAAQRDARVRSERDAHRCTHRTS